MLRRPEHPRWAVPRLRPPGSLARTVRILDTTSAPALERSNGKSLRQVRGSGRCRPPPPIRPWATCVTAESFPETRSILGPPRLWPQPNSVFGMNCACTRCTSCRSNRPLLITTRRESLDMRTKEHDAPDSIARGGATRERAAAKRAGLKYVSDSTRGIRREAKGAGVPLRRTKR